MHNALTLPNFNIFLLLFVLSLIIIYYIVKVAVRNGVDQRLTEIEN